MSAAIIAAIVSGISGVLAGYVIGYRKGMDDAFRVCSEKLRGMVAQHD